MCATASTCVSFWPRRTPHVPLDYLQAGNVKFVDLFQEPGGRSKGCAIVEYETPQEAHTAIRELHDTELNGRMMFVREDREEVRSGVTCAFE